MNPTNPTNPINPTSGPQPLDVALHLGGLLVRHGAETWRVEDTVSRLLVALGLDDSDVVATMTSLIATVRHGPHRETQVRRLRPRGTDLAAIDYLNDLSRQVAAGTLDVAGLDRALDALERRPSTYTVVGRAAGALIGAAGFAILFDGTVAELFLSLPIALAIFCFHELLGRLRYPVLLSTALTAFVGTLLAVEGTHLIGVSNPSTLVLVAVIHLVPGATIVSAIGDLLGGHLLAGLARSASAALVASAIAAGVVVGLWLNQQLF